MQTDHTPIWVTLAVALIVALPGTLAAVVSALSLRQSKRNATKVDELKRNTDGMQTTLQDLNKAQGRAEGVAEGREGVVAETQARTVEAERVEDRADERKK